MAVAHARRGDAAVADAAFQRRQRGAHTPNDLDFQEFMLASLGASGYAEAVRAGAEVYAALKARLGASGHATGLGDEGLAPQIARSEEVLSELVGAITDAGYEPGRNGVAIALDPAASEFYRDGTYHVAGATFSGSDMVGYDADLVDRFPSGASRTAWPRTTGRAGRS
jgi:enolase 1/2/3